MLNITQKLLFALIGAGLNKNEIAAYTWLYGKVGIGRKRIVYRADFLKWYKGKCRLNPDAKVEQKYTGEMSVRDAPRPFEKLDKIGFAEIRKIHGGILEVILFDAYSVLGLNCQDSPETAEDEKSQDAEPPMAEDQSPRTEEGKQQQLIEANKILRKEGIKFKLYDMFKIIKYGIEAITLSVKLFKKRSLTSKIENPCGWIRSCLQRGWWKDSDALTVKKSDIERYLELQEYLLDELGTLPTAYRT